MQHLPSSTASLTTVDRKSALTSWAVFAAILLVYLLFPTKNYYWDGIFFARVIEAAPELHPSLLHPNHLLYNVIGYVLYKATRAVGLQWRAIEVLQFANIIVSVSTAYVLYKILRRTLRSNYLVWSLTLAFAFSSTWWKFSTDANAYIFSVFCLLLAFYLTLDEFKPRPLLVTLIFSLAVLMHQLAVFAYPVIAVALYRQAAEMSQTRRRLVVAQFCLWSFVLVFATYCYCFYLTTGAFSPASFMRWIANYSPDASFSFDVLSNIGYTLRGNVRLFFNARPSLLRGLLSPAIVGTIVVFGIVILLWLIALAKGTRLRLPRNFSSLVEGNEVRNYLFWIGVYLLFLFFWLPHNTFYRLFYLPPIILLIGTYLRRRDADLQKPRYRLALFVAVMALSNFLFFIYPNSRAEKYPPLSLALEMNRVWQPGAVVYFHSENSDNNLVAYFNPAIEWRPLRDLEQTQIELKQIYDQGKTAWLDASAIDQIMSRAEGGEWLARHGRTETWHERKARGYNVKFIQVGP